VVKSVGVIERKPRRQKGTAPGEKQRMWAEHAYLGLEGGLYSKLGYIETVWRLFPSPRQ